MEGSFLVVSGPGTGKTTLLVSRIQKILADHSDEAGRSLALTFTNKASAEIRERLAARNPEYEDGCLVATFHTLSTRILRAHGESQSVPPEYTVYYERDQLAVIDKLQRRGSIATEEDPHELLSRFDRLKNHAAELGNELELVDPLFGGPAFLAYEAELRRLAAIDFADMVYLANKVLVTRPEIASVYRTAYPRILVDEFQDTTASQYALLRRLSAIGKSQVFAVADVDQLIFEWNKARVETINQFVTDYSPRVIFSKLSHRCPPRVLAAANSVIRRNKLRFAEQPEIESEQGRADQGRVVVRGFQDATSEAAYVAETVKSLVQAGETLDGIAILARSRYSLEAVKIELTLRGIAASEPTTGGLGSGEEGEFLIRLLRWIQNPGDEYSARAVVFFLDPAQVESVDYSVEQAESQGSPFESVLVDTLGRQAGGERVLTFVESVAGWRLASTNPTKLLGSLAGSLPRLLAGFGVVPESIDSVKSGVAGLESVASRLFPGGRIPIGELLLNLPKESASRVVGGVIPLLTVHQSKGLEFRHVFIIAMERGQFPDYRSERTPRAIEEERRLFYVGLTRSSSEVYLTFSRLRKDSKGFERRREPSEFLSELPAEVVGEEL